MNDVYFVPVGGRGGVLTNDRKKAMAVARATFRPRRHRNARQYPVIVHVFDMHGTRFYWEFRYDGARWRSEGEARWYARAVSELLASTLSELSAGGAA